MLFIFLNILKNITYKWIISEKKIINYIRCDDNMAWLGTSLVPCFLTQKQKSMWLWCNKPNDATCGGGSNSVNFCLALLRWQFLTKPTSQLDQIWWEVSWHSYKIFLYLFRSGMVQCHRFVLYCILFTYWVTNYLHLLILIRQLSDNWQETFNEFCTIALGLIWFM